jgi:hypothetical protein
MHARPSCPPACAFDAKLSSLLLSVSSGNFGFDPLGLGKDADALQRFRESELIHCRWSMLGVAGVLAVELLGFGNWYDAPLWAINGGKATWFGVDVPFDITTLVAVVRGAGRTTTHLQPKIMRVLSSVELG